MALLAVIDTNVLVSSIITRDANSPTVRILRAVLSGAITPLYVPAIIAEYRDVLSRPKFNLDSKLVQTLISAIMEYGIEVQPIASSESFSDEGDRIFYETALSRQDSPIYLVTGNQRHFPKRPFIVTPSEMAQIAQI